MSRKHKSWYEENIESGIRGAVKLLRDNGFNTTCSCEHDMVIIGTYGDPVDLDRLHALLLHEGYKDYTVTVQLSVMNGILFSSKFRIIFDPVWGKEHEHRYNW
jgi:hypothetical protein